MEKKKYDVTIADVAMSIISDEREDFVARLVKELDEKIREITLASKRCSTLDAAILVALESSGEKLKADKRIRTLEAQIGLYDANLRRVREENAKLKSAMLSGTAAVAEEAAAVQDEDEDPEQMPIAADTEKVEEVAASAPAEEPVPEEAVAEEEAPVKESAPEEAPARADKLRQIESLLRGRE